jgi:nicotinamide mononucleotide transporter
MSNWEIVGSVLGVIGVLLMIRQSIWAWPIGIVQVAVYAWVFYTAKLYSDAILQIVFIGIQAYGWWHWAHGDELTHARLPVTRLTARALLLWIAAGAVATIAWGELMRRLTDAALPHWDAFILIFSLISQWLQARKKLECWAGWIVVNLAAIPLYWQRDLKLTAALYAVFLVLAVLGHSAWRRTMRGESGS